MRIAHVLSCFATLALLAACTLNASNGIDDKTKAGGACSEPQQCQSGDCRSNVCTGRACGTDTAEPGNCESGWTCQHYDQSCLLNVFCDTSGYRCIITCGAGCPKGTYCPAGNTDPGTECEYGTPPAAPLPNPPTVSISAQYWAHPGEAVPFAANINRVGDVTISSTTWDFGDGATGSSQQATHAYAKVGAYTVKVTITDNYNRTDEAEQTMGICLDKGDPCTKAEDCCDNPSVTCNSSGLCADPF